MRKKIENNEEEKESFVTQKPVCPKVLMNHLKAKFAGPTNFCQQTDFDFQRMCEILEDDVQPTEYEYLTLLHHLKVTPAMLSPYKEMTPAEEFEAIIAEKLRQFVYAHDGGMITTDQFSRAFARLIPFLIPRKVDLSETTLNSVEVAKLFLDARDGKVSENLRPAESKLVELLEEHQDEEA